MRVLAVMFTLLLPVIPLGCGDSTTSPTPLPPTVRTVWLGTYTSTGAADHGVVMFDLRRTGDNVTADGVLRSRTASQPYRLLELSGTGSQAALHLERRAGATSPTIEFVLDAEIQRDTLLCGSFDLNAPAMRGSVKCRAVPVGSIETETLGTLRTTVHGLATRGSELWVSTVDDDYWVLDQDGNLRSVVTVFYRPGVRWTSEDLASDGDFLWGHLPGTETGPSGSGDFSTILKFGTDGLLRSEYRVDRRMGGLTWDGARLWLLSQMADGLYHYDSTGVVRDSIRIDVPELAAISHDGVSFLGIGALLPRLYRIDGTGSTREVYDLPDTPPGAFPAGIATAGQDLWYARTTPFQGGNLFSTLFRLRLSSPRKPAAFTK